MNGLVALTGATGFIGARLCAHLLERHHAVRALVRDPAKAEHFPVAGAEVVRGDLFDTGALQRLVDGCDAVVHLAGAVRGNDLSRFMHTNDEGTAMLLDATASAAPGARFLMVSSLAAREPGLSWYARSKREAEQRVQASALDWLILRPPAVYGPGDEEMKAVFTWMARGIAPVPGRAEARTSLIHVDDLVRAMVACLASPAATGRVLELCDGKAGGYDWREMATIAGNAYGRPVRLVHLPGGLLNAAARLNLWLARRTGRAAMLTPPKLRELRHDNWVVDNRAITEVTGWVPRNSLHDGLKNLAKTAV
jgi:nucleoside-diphosphate-sugar epimerase